MQKYSIVEFNEENTVEVIPSSWISFDKKTTLWPNTISPAILKKYLKNNTEPNDDWTSVHIRVLGHADCLTEAMKKAERAQDTSQLSSNDNSTSETYTTNTRQKKSQHKHHNLSDKENDPSEKQYNVNSEKSPTPNKKTSIKRGEEAKKSKTVSYQSNSSDEDDALASSNQYKINSEKGPKSNKNTSIQRNKAEKSKKVSYRNLNSSSDEEDNLASGNQCTVNLDKRPNVPSFPELDLQRDSQADSIVSNKNNTNIQRNKAEKSKKVSYQNLNSSSGEEDDLASRNQCTVNLDNRPNVPSFPELDLQRDSQADSILSNKNNIQRSKVEKSKNIEQIKKGILTKIFKVMEEIKFEVNALKTEQKEIKVKLDTLLTHNDNSVINQFSHLLPICSMESFDEIDQSLKISEENFISLVKYLNLGSGETIKVLVPSIIKLLMKKAVAMHFSSSGKQKKRDFSATKVAAAVFEIVSKTIPNVSRNEILQKISKFLAESGDREGGRKERFLKSTN